MLPPVAPLEAAGGLGAAVEAGGGADDGEEEGHRYEEEREILPKTRMPIKGGRKFTQEEGQRIRALKRDKVPATTRMQGR